MNSTSLDQGYEIWNALVQDILEEGNRETAINMMVTVIAGYMKRNGITIHDGRVHHYGQPYVPKIEDCQVIPGML